MPSIYRPSRSLTSLCVIRQLVYCHCKSASSQASGEKANEQSQPPSPSRPGHSVPAQLHDVPDKPGSRHVCMRVQTRRRFYRYRPAFPSSAPIHPSNKRQLYEHSTTSTTTTSSRSSKSSSMHLRRPCHACLTVQTCHNHPPARSQHADGAIGMIVSSRAHRSSASVLAENRIPSPAQKKGPASKAREPRLPAASH